MNQSPIVLLVGPAGSGKDTVASFFVKNHGAVAIAQADPMKRLAKRLFGFTDEQLWGPSSARNAPDPRFNTPPGWNGPDRTVAHVANILSMFIGPCGDSERKLFRDWYDNVKRACHPDASGKHLTPRYVLQTLGTEFGRSINPDLWSHIAIDTAKRLLTGGYAYTREDGLTEVSGEPGPTRVVITDGRFRNEVLNVRYINGEIVRIDPEEDATAAAEATATAGVAGHKSESEMKGIPGHFFTSFFCNSKSKGLEECERRVDSLVKSWNGTFVCVGGIPT